MAHQEAAEKTGEWELGIPTIGGGNDGNMIRGDREINHEEAEHGHAVYCDVTDSGPL